MTDLTTVSINELLQTQRAQILAIATQHGAYNVRIFGSVARNEANADSDIDFLVDYDSTKRSPWFPSGLVQDLEALLQRNVDVATPAMLKPRIKDQVLREAISL
jgi:uncharacterized protein